ncbi:MAG: hypothetical protein NTU43_06510 [Bacteroidetes bacterium]|nr:hypothetical protein [Bacteroidota bacterium]
MKSRRTKLLIMMLLLYVALCVGISQKLIKGFGTIDNIPETVLNYDAKEKSNTVLTSIELQSNRK